MKAAGEMAALLFGWVEKNSKNYCNRTGKMVI